MLVSGYYTACLIYALILVTLRAQFQGLIVMMAAPYVTDNSGLATLVVFTSFSYLFGRARSAAES